MIEVTTLKEAHAVKQSDDGRGVIAIEAGSPCRVYFDSDELPAHMRVDPDPRAEMIAALTAAVQTHLDATAQAHGYDDIRSAISYQGDAVDLWHRQALACRAWRSVVWQACIAIQGDVLAGNRAAPSAGELIAELPQAEIPT